MKTALILKLIAALTALVALYQQQLSALPTPQIVFGDAATSTRQDFKQFPEDPIKPSLTARQFYKTYSYTCTPWTALDGYHIKHSDGMSVEAYHMASDTFATVNITYNFVPTSTPLNDVLFPTEKTTCTDGTNNYILQ